MIDKEKIKEGVKLILEGIGEDAKREGLRDTPERVARMYEEIYSGYAAIENGEDAINLKKTFSVQDSELVIEKDIGFYSMCEHHMLPFYGKVHIAYVPDGKVVGLSKLARTVEVFARKLQVQENMTVEIADAIMEYLSPKGVLVIAKAEHMCMTMRGIKKPGSSTVTIARRGVFKDDETLCDRIFGLIQG